MMNSNRLSTIITISIIALLGLLLQACSPKETDDRFVSYIADPSNQNIALYWKDEHQEHFTTIQNLKNWLNNHNKELVFAMNGGMYQEDYSPKGLYIERQQTLAPLDTTQGNGNFYLMPNGVFYITVDNIPTITTTSSFKNNGRINYATQSGPMLVIDGQIHSAFKKGSTNLNIRNGVGILPNNKILLAMSKKEINFYDFAEYFQKMGCKNALYLDGFVSRTYLPEHNWFQTDGSFGVIIGITAD